MNSTPIAIAVVEQHGCFLIGQRPSGSVLSGLWEFPGGKVHDGETPAQCAVRECIEETGIVVEVLRLVGQRAYDYDHGSVELHFFACRPLDQTTEPQLPFRWVRREDLARYEFPPANEELLQSLLAGDAAGSVPR